MTRINDSGDSSPITPADRKMYEEEYKKGAELFQNALDQYSQSSNMYQREEFKDVMRKAMDVLNNSAAGLKEKALLEQNKKIEQDYAKFKTKEDPETQAKLEKDLDQARKSIRE